MDRVTFTARLVPSFIQEEEPLPPMAGSLKDRIQGPVFRKLENIRGDASRILSGVNFRDDNTISYHYLTVHSIQDHTIPPFTGDAGDLTPEDLENFHGKVMELTFRVRNGMLYQNSDFCEEWVQGFKAVILLPVGELIKIFMPIVLSIPCINHRLSENWQNRVRRQIEICLPLKALAGLAAQICLSILWCITLGLLSTWINYLRGDIERWENGHNGAPVREKFRPERISEMFYFTSLAQPITTFDTESVHLTQDGKVDLMTTGCIPPVQRKMIAHIIAGKNLADHRFFRPSINEDILNLFYRNRNLI